MRLKVKPSVSIAWKGRRAYYSLSVSEFEEGKVTWVDGDSGINRREVRVFRIRSDEGWARSRLVCKSLVFRDPVVVVVKVMIWRVAGQEVDVVVLALDGLVS